MMDSCRLLVRAVIKLASKTVAIAHYTVTARVSDGGGNVFLFTLISPSGCGLAVERKRVNDEY